RQYVMFYILIVAQKRLPHTVNVLTIKARRRTKFARLASQILNRDHTVVSLSLLLVALLAFDDPDDTPFEATPRESRVVHQNQDVRRVSTICATLQSVLRARTPGNR